MAWKLLSRDDVQKLVDAQLPHLDAGARSRFLRHSIPPTRVPAIIVAGGEVDEEAIWMVARAGNHLLIYHSIEEEFGTGHIDHDGLLRHWSIGGGVLAWSLADFPPAGLAEAREADLRGEPETVQRVGDHIEAHIGPVGVVFHEESSRLVHLDVYHVAPGPDRPFHTLITSGMSDLPMTTPPSCEHLRCAELLIHLPASWPVSMEAFDDERHYWPVRWLKILGRHPHEASTWFGYGHSIPMGTATQSWAPGTGFVAALLLPPFSLPDQVHTLDMRPDKVVRFWSVVPLYKEELNLKLKKGTDALLRRFDKFGITDVVDVERVNAAKRSGGRST